MESWLRQREYISPEITNELITMMGQFVLRSLLTNIRMALWFSILADEATDISHHEQMSLSIRWVDENYVIHEDVLGLFQLPDTRAATYLFGNKGHPDQMYSTNISVLWASF